MKDPRDILGVPWDADPRHIKAAYKKLAAKFHPDRNPDDPSAAERLKEVIEAYQFLTNPAAAMQAERRSRRAARSAAAAVNPAEFRRQAQFRFAFEQFIESLQATSFIPWRPIRVVLAYSIGLLALVPIVTGHLVLGTDDHYGEETFFVLFLLLALHMIIRRENYAEMPVSISRRGRFDRIIPEWLVEAYGWMGLSFLMLFQIGFWTNLFERFAQ